MPMPLEGIRVIDWTIYQQGPVASAMLGDLGAEVIKIEEPQRGDPGRGMAGVMGISTNLPGGKNYYFETNNRNKKGITLDLKKPRALEIVRRLVERADVFVHNFRQGVEERLGVDYQTLCRYNPRLIYAVASGYGPQGPESRRPSVDPVGLARTGFMEANTNGSVPPYPQGGLADQMGATMLAYGVLAALMARERFGVGQKLDVSHLGSMMWLQAMALHGCLLLGRELPKFRRERAANPMNNYYRCQDGRWLFLALMQPDRHWPNFCQALGRADLQEDPRFVTADKRRENREALIRILDEVFAQKTSQEWCQVLGNFEDFIFEVVRSLGEVPQDPQVLANEYITEFHHPTLGPVKMVNLPVKLSQTPGSLRLPAPELGQHTEEVLLEVCGYSWEDIARFREEEVI